MLPALDLNGLKAGEGLPEINLEQYLGLWAIEETAGNQMWQMVTSMDLASHVRTSSVRQAPPDAVMDENIAIIQIRGTMTKGGSSLSSAGSTVRLRQQVRQAANDPNVDGILLIIDSPGGTVAGTADLGDEINAATKKKPVVSLAEDLMASAAIWVGSQADLVFANSDHATVGSKGVFIGLYDYSGAAAKEGIRPVVIRTGDLKGAGFPGAEVSDEQKKMWQGMVDAANASFDAAMSKRKMSSEALQELSRGGVFTAKAATSMGLIDGVRSQDGAIAELRGLIQKKKGTDRKQGKMTDQSPAASLNELEAACRGADEKFILGQLRNGATVKVASESWMSALHARNAELGAEVKRLGEFESKFADADAKVKTLEADLAGANSKLAEANAALAKKPHGVKVLADITKPKAESESESDGTATEQFNAKVDALVKSGMAKGKAISKVVRENANLHTAMLEEANSGRKAS